MSDLPHARRLVCGVVLGQTTLALIVASGAWALGGTAAGASALGGAAVAWVTALYARSRALTPAATAGAALLRVMLGELIRVVATIALFMLAARLPHTVWPALLCGYVAALLGGWLTELAAARRDQERAWARARLVTHG